jgi:hypothetical protein
VSFDPADDTRISAAHFDEIVAAQDHILRGLIGPRPWLDQRTLRRLPPWRAVLMARIAHKAGLMDRRAMDALIREAELVGGEGTLKPFDKLAKVAPR